jgi:hypothetical protein
VVAAASTAEVFGGAGSLLVAAGSFGSSDGEVTVVFVVVVVVDVLTACVLAHDGVSATSTHNAPSPPPSFVGVSGHDAAIGAPDSVT